MRKLIVSEFLTLDGVMEAPNEWSFPFWTDEAAQYKFTELFASDALLLGRVTYEGFAAAWPSRSDSEPTEGAIEGTEAGAGENPFADRMNGMTKYVVSTTLDEVAWNNSHLIKGNIAEEIARLKQQPGQDILVAGSATLIQTLMEHNLVDEYRLMVYPVVVGKGKRLFPDGNPKTVLKLVDTQTYSSGVIVLTYHPAPKE